MEEFEYQDTSKRGRWIMILGIALALVAGAGAFTIVNQAQSDPALSETVPVVVAARTIPGRKTIELDDLVVKQVPVELAGTASVADPNQLVSRVTAVTVMEGQVVSTNLLASSEINGQFSILKPEEKVTSDSPYWRAVALTVPDDRAVGGLVAVGMSVDVFVTTTVAVAGDATQVSMNGLITDKSTKLTYQDLEVLAKTGTAYIVRVPVAVAEEIEHLQATGAAQFSLALRPSEDTRIADTSRLGATTNLVVSRYDLPASQPIGAGAYTGTTKAFPIPTPNPITTISTAPTTAPTTP